MRNPKHDTNENGLDQLISHKRQELKDLLFARDAMEHLQAVTGEGMEEIRLLPAPEAPAPKKKRRKKRKAASPAAPTEETSHGKEENNKPKPLSKAARMQAIADGAKNTGPGFPGSLPAVVPGKRRKFSTEQKRYILNQYDAAQVKGDVLKEYDLSFSAVARWREQLPSDGAVVASPTVFGFETQTVITETDDDEGGDLLDEMGGGETHVPFGAAPTAEDLAPT